MVIVAPSSRNGTRKSFALRRYRPDPEDYTFFSGGRYRQIIGSSGFGVEGDAYRWACMVCLKPPVWRRLRVTPKPEEPFSFPSPVVSSLTVLPVASLQACL